MFSRKRMRVRSVRSNAEKQRVCPIQAYHQLLLFHQCLLLQTFILLISCVCGSLSESTQLYFACSNAYVAFLISLLYCMTYDKFVWFFLAH